MAGYFLPYGGAPIDVMSLGIIVVGIWIAADWLAVSAPASHEQPARNIAAYLFDVSADGEYATLQ
jgi:hypothetical protein